MEPGYDELKTELLEREEAIRSKKLDGVRQELWGILLAYNLIRVEMEQVAREAKVDPTRISAVFAIRLIRDELLWLAVTSPGAIPKWLAGFDAISGSISFHPAAPNADIQGRRAQDEQLRPKADGGGES